MRALAGDGFGCRLGKERVVARLRRLQVIGRLLKLAALRQCAGVVAPFHLVEGRLRLLHRGAHSRARPAHRCARIPRGSANERLIRALRGGQIGFGCGDVGGPRRVGKLRQAGLGGVELRLRGGKIGGGGGGLHLGKLRLRPEVGCARLRQGDLGGGVIQPG